MNIDKYKPIVGIEDPEEDKKEEDGSMTKILAKMLAGAQIDHAKAVSSDIGNDEYSQAWSEQ